MISWLPEDLESSKQAGFNLLKCLVFKGYNINDLHKRRLIYEHLIWFKKPRSSLWCNFATLQNFSAIVSSFNLLVIKSLFHLHVKKNQTDPSMLVKVVNEANAD